MGCEGIKFRGIRLNEIRSGRAERIGKPREIGLTGDLLLRGCLRKAELYQQNAKHQRECKAAALEHRGSFQIRNSGVYPI